ncbi:MAG TPA: dCMP deaminase family protein [Bacillota bacterium]|nr:dCMP deaminase family protein [Bacillota bacterium]
MTKRTDYISWDDYFLGIALLAARRSKDPGTQVGACIVTPANRVVSIGYNGMPYGCSDDEFPWNREGDALGTKYAYVCHAELNAILNAAGHDLNGCRIYVPLFPCNECAKAIIQSGINKVLYLSDKYKDTDIVIASKRMLRAAGVELVQLQPETEELRLSFRIEDV